MPTPHFRNGYNKDLDVTEDEYLDAYYQNYYDEGDVLTSVSMVWDTPWEPEGEPNEDTYLPGIPDYDRFNRPSWGEEA